MPFKRYLVGSGIGGSSNVVENGEEKTRRSLEETLKFAKNLNDLDLKIVMGMSAVGEI